MEIEFAAGARDGAIRNERDAGRKGEGVRRCKRWSGVGPGGTRGALLSPSFSELCASTCGIGLGFFEAGDCSVILA